MIRYRVMDPSGNITILVETPVPEASQPSVALKLMELEKDAEQVGFLSPGDGCDISLRMAGGEFCGNATMSAAAAAAENAGTDEGSLLVRVSGCPDLVRADVTRLPDGSFRGAVDMPRPLAVEEMRLPLGTPGGESAQQSHAAGLSADLTSGWYMLPVVHFEGISHVIIGGERESVVAGEAWKSRAEELARQWCSYLKKSALGLMFLDAESSRMTPLVYVPGADTLVWENSCASGTTAAGARRRLWTFPKS